ncbi:unnamed protein product [Rotaria sp. Silwood2]|nr:unnamed protein product [Rotaria sp. Silwood2]CAF4447402.1 unnamed protein product [Rotaria sp. Silwood2]CAF4559751.1 unnamed protein product [Rotaria sp. Silwood2]
MKTKGLVFSTYTFDYNSKSEGGAKSNSNQIDVCKEVEDDETNSENENLSYSEGHSDINGGITEDKSIFDAKSEAEDDQMYEKRKGEKHDDEELIQQ